MLRIQLPHRIGSNQQGFASLANIYQQVKSCKFETIQLDFQNTNWFDAIVDIGQTIRKNVRDYKKNQTYSGKETVAWAVQKNTTTRKDNIPGGLGFTLIRDFLCKNNGKMQIASADGYWYEKGGVSHSKDLNVFFRGTAVNFEFNVNDTSSYCLSSEIEDTDIPF